MYHSIGIVSNGRIQVPRKCYERGGLVHRTKYTLSLK